MAASAAPVVVRGAAAGLWQVARRALCQRSAACGARSAGRLFAPVAVRGCRLDGSRRWLSSTSGGSASAAASGGSPSAPATAGGASPSAKLAAALASELQYEKSNYEPAEAVQSFLSGGAGWKLTEKEGDVSMKLTKTHGNLAVSVEFQLVSPTYSGAEEEEDAGSGGEGEGAAAAATGEPQETTDFSVAVETPEGRGAIFYCTTVNNDDKYRFIVGNVRYFGSAAERASVSAFNGPEFEDLDEALQTGVDDWLASIGVNDELCNFVDAMAVDKEQREYMRWLENVGKVLTA